MQECGNLNQYSQQGWEALNALMTFFFFQRTNKGGFRSGADPMSCNGQKSKLIPIIRLVQHRLLFIFKIINTDYPDMLDNIESN